MPPDFDLKANGLTKLRVAVLHGLGPPVQRPQLTILGYNRQRIPGNWKLMQENIKDPYHPGLLHTWFVTFGLWRADNKSRCDGRAAPPRGDDLHARQCGKAAR
jgi:salicylate 5-hydroxylase large subunit